MKKIWILFAGLSIAMMGLAGCAADSSTEESESTEASDESLKAAVKKGLPGGPGVLSESVPCCKSDDQGCICSSDDCDDCKDVTRESLQMSTQASSP